MLFLMRRTSVLVLIVLGVIGLQEPARAGSNCSSGSCQLPAVPPEPPATRPIFTPRSQVILNGVFNPYMEDPSWGDDSFMYYKELIGTWQWKTYQTIAQQSNTSCTTCLPTTVSLVTPTAPEVDIKIDLNANLFANSETIKASAVSTQPVPTKVNPLDAFLPQDLAKISSPVDSDAGNALTNDLTSKDIAVTYNLDCCSANRILKETLHEVDSYLERWQIDHIFGWVDSVRFTTGPERKTSGISIATALGICSGSQSQPKPGTGGLNPVDGYPHVAQLDEVMSLALPLAPMEPTLASAVPLPMRSFASSLQVSSAPGPLPVLGGGVAFHFSRRLKRRIQASRQLI